MSRKRMIVLAAMVLAAGLAGCSGQKAAQGPKQEYVTKNLVPAKAEAKGADIQADLSDLQVSATMNPASKEIVETPRLSGSYKITNTSKELVDVQAVNLQYLDKDGKPIAFSSGKKTATTTLSVTSLKPGDSTEGSLDVTMPKAAMAGLAKIDIDVVYVPSPLKEETLGMAEKVE